MEFRILDSRSNGVSLVTDLGGRALALLLSPAPQKLVIKKIAPTYPEIAMVGFSSSGVLL